MGSPKEQDHKQGVIGRGYGPSRAAANKPAAVLFGYRELVGSAMQYVIGLITGAMIGGAIGYVGKCTGST